MFTYLNNFEEHFLYFFKINVHGGFAIYYNLKIMEITQFNQLNLDKLYTYTDYLSWKFEERVELLKGKIFKMAAPNRACFAIKVNWTNVGQRVPLIW